MSSDHQHGTPYVRAVRFDQRRLSWHISIFQSTITDGTWVTSQSVDFMKPFNAHRIYTGRNDNFVIVFYVSNMLSSTKLKRLLCWLTKHWFCHGNVKFLPMVHDHWQRMSKESLNFGHILGKHLHCFPIGLSRNWPAIKGLTYPLDQLFSVNTHLL